MASFPLRPVRYPPRGALVASASRVLWVAEGSGEARAAANLLAHDGFQVDLADGEQALTLCAGGHYDLALVDSRRPGSDGLATLRQLRRTAPALRAVLVTGYEQTDLLRQAMREGVEAVFQHPADAARFLPLLLA